MTVRAETDALMALAAAGRRKEEGGGPSAWAAGPALRAIWRARRAALTGAALAVAVAAIALSAAPPRWTAEAEILLEPDDLAQGAPLSAQSIESQARLLLSRGLLDTVVSGLRLEEDLATGAPIDPAAGLLARLGAEARHAMGAWRGDANGLGSPGADPAARRAAAVDALAAMLSVRRAGESRSLIVSAVDVSPRRAALIANAAADAFLADQARVKRDSAQRADTWLRARLAEIAPRLAAAEADIDALRLSALSDRPDGAAARVRLGEFAAARDALAAKGAAPDDPRRRALDGAVAALASGLARDASAATALRGAQAEVQTLREARDGAVRRLEAAAAQPDLYRPDARMIAAATPPRRPSGPSLALPLALAGAAGLLAGVLVYLAREALLGLPDSPGALARMCGAPVIAALAPTSARRPDSVLDARARPGGAAAEAGRALRVAALHAAEMETVRRHPGREREGGRARQRSREHSGRDHSGREQPRRDNSGREQPGRDNSGPETPRGLVIATAGVQIGSGASAMAALLAEACARMGLTVCLVDGDLRAPAQAARYGLEAETDLLAVLDGESLLEDALWPVDPPGLTVLPAAPAPASRGEVLAEGGMEHVIAALRARFDVVVIDAPAPCLAADGRLLAGLADATVLVLRWGAAGRGPVRAALAALDSAGAVCAGVALTEARGAAAAPISTWSQGRFGRFAEGFAD